LAKQRNYLLRAEPLLRHDHAPFQNSFYQTAWSKKARSGQSVSLPPAKAQALAMVLHELGTNAAKYGALSTSSGSVNLSWELDSGCLILHWSEKGGPRVEPPNAYGFGTKIINSTLVGQASGNVNLDWRPDGLNCTLTIPIGSSDNASASVKNGNGHDNKPITLKHKVSKRVLLVEDEMLVGMMMRDLLINIGYYVIGPVPSVAEAISVAGTQSFDSGVLDINMGTEFIYPLAEFLRNKEVPFIFLTGYSSESIDPRFRDVMVLQKPVDRESLTRALRTSHDA
jgi:CheY-like chemotaxis protein